MTGDFCTVLASVGVGRLKEADHTFVENLRAILDLSVMDGVWLGVVEVFAKHMRKNLKRLNS